MSDDTVTDVVRNIDARLTRVEQFLPTLATREELLTTGQALHVAIAEAVEPLATRKELHEAIAAAVAPLVTRDEFETKIATLVTREEFEARVAQLATREEMYAAIKAEGESARHHATMLFEDLRDDNRLILEHLLALSARVDLLASR